MVDVYVFDKNIKCMYESINRVNVDYMESCLNLNGWGNEIEKKNFVLPEIFGMAHPGTRNIGYATSRLDKYLTDLFRKESKRDKKSKSVESIDDHFIIINDTSLLKGKSDELIGFDDMVGITRLKVLQKNIAKSGVWVDLESIGKAFESETLNLKSCSKKLFALEDLKGLQDSDANHKITIDISDSERAVELSLKRINAYARLQGVLEGTYSRDHCEPTDVVMGYLYVLNEDTWEKTYDA